MTKDDAYLADILAAASSILRFTDGVTKVAFLNNEEKYEAVIRKLQIIGEAAKRISPETKAKINGVPWALITGMRDVLVHDYDDVDLDMVWETVQTDIPMLRARIEDSLNG